MPEQFKDLWYINGWDLKKPPQAYQKCREANHTLTYENTGRCCRVYYCGICKIKWTEDSSD